MGFGVFYNSSFLSLPLYERSPDCMLVGVLPRIGLFTDTYLFLKMTLIFSVVFQVVL